MEHQQALDRDRELDRSGPVPGDPERQVVGLHPEVWIGRRTDYDGERANGGWVSVARREPEVLADVRAIIGRTPADLGDAWGMFEARGFGMWQPTGQERLSTVMAIARRIVEFGPPYSALVAAVGPDSLAIQGDRYQVSYIGAWPSLRDFVSQVAIDSGWYERLAELPGSMRAFVTVDFDALMQQAAADLTIVPHPEGIWVFDPRVW